MTSPHRLPRSASLTALSVCIGLLAIGPVRAEPLSASVGSSPQTRPRSLVLPHGTLPTAPEPDAAVSTGPGPNPLTSRAAGPNATSAGQTLTAPVTVNAATTADALTVTQTGGGRAISGAVTNGSNGLSAVKGITAGSGSGVNGVNGGTGGQAGKFEITNASSMQPSLLVTTAGNGSGVQAIVKGTAQNDVPAVSGQHNGTTNYGVGVQGDGGSAGVVGTGAQVGIVGDTTSETGYPGTGIGVYGNSTSGYGMYALSGSGEGLHAYSSSSNGVKGISASGGSGVYGVSNGSAANSYGVTGQSAHYAGVFGLSSVAIGVLGQSDSGNGIVGQSNTGYAGLFHGPVYASGSVTAASYGYTSDRDLKQDFTAVDSGDVLSRIAAMPITSWDYKAKPAERHIGPMAQDFRAAFGLGADERHIDVVDGIGVSLAAIKELQRQLVERDARIDRLEAQLQARIVTLEQGAAAASSGVTAAQPN